MITAASDNTQLLFHSVWVTSLVITGSTESYVVSHRALEMNPSQAHLGCWLKSVLCPYFFAACQPTVVPISFSLFPASHMTAPAGSNFLSRFKSSHLFPDTLLLPPSQSSLYPRLKWFRLDLSGSSRIIPLFLGSSTLTTMYLCHAREYSQVPDRWTSVQWPSA